MKNGELPHIGGQMKYPCMQLYLKLHNGQSMAFIKRNNKDLKFGYKK